MKYTANKVLCTYTTPDGKYTIRKHFATENYYLYSGSKLLQWNEDIPHKNSKMFGSIGFGLLKDAKAFVESLYN